LYGLLLFLGVDPYWVKHWWDVILYKPYCFGKKEPMHQAIAQVLWRTSKVDVLDQLGLPTQSEKIHWLKFSPVEEHFYRQQYAHRYKQATDVRFLCSCYFQNERLNPQA
jgi:E3 ubiquitin-protein ligase SHPRH